MGLTILAISFGIVGVVVGAGALILSILAFIELKALKNSTHNIQFVPVTEEAAAKSDEELSKQFKKSGIMTEPFDEIPDEVIL